MCIHILPAGPSDASSILDLQHLAFQSEAVLYATQDLPPLRQTLEELQAEFGAKRFWRASQHGQIVGSVRGYQIGGTVHLERLIVHPSHQRQGIGRQLVECFEQAWPGANRIELFTGHLSSVNLLFYTSLGYQLFRSEVGSDSLRITYLYKKLSAKDA